MIKYDSSNDICYMLGSRMCQLLRLPVEKEENPDIFAGGPQLASSVMDYVNGKRTVFVWGSGYLRNPAQYNKNRLIRILQNKQLLAVSGNLTKEFCEKLGYFPSYATVGNLYLLTSLIWPKEGKAIDNRESIEAQVLPPEMDLENRILIVTDDRTLPTVRSKFPSADFLSTNTTTLNFLKVVSSAKQILTTSASVLAIAHSYGIPAGYLRVEPFKKNDRIFEVEDYYSQFGEDFTVFTSINSLAGNAITCPSEIKIKSIQGDLLRVLPESLTNYRVSKLMADLGIDDDIAVEEVGADGLVNVKVSLDGGMTFIDWKTISKEQVFNEDVFAIKEEGDGGLEGFNEMLGNGEYILTSAEVVKLDHTLDTWQRNQKFHFENGMKVVLNFDQVV